MEIMKKVQFRVGRLGREFVGVLLTCDSEHHANMRISAKNEIFYRTPYRAELSRTVLRTVQYGIEYITGHNTVRYGPYEC